MPLARPLFERDVAVPGRRLPAHIIGVGHDGDTGDACGVLPEGLPLIFVDIALLSYPIVHRRRCVFNH
jgi:hypothetical protein